MQNLMPNSAVKLVDAATATGAGAAMAGTLSEQPIAIQLTATGVPTTLTAALEGSLDGTNWVPLATLSDAGMAWSVDKPAKFIRGNITGLSGGTSPTATLWAWSPQR